MTNKIFNFNQKMTIISLDLQNYLTKLKISKFYYFLCSETLKNVIFCTRKTRSFIEFILLKLIKIFFFQKIFLNCLTGRFFCYIIVKCNADCLSVLPCFAIRTSGAFFSGVPIYISQRGGTEYEKNISA